MKIANVKLGTLCSIEGCFVHSAEAIEFVTELKDAMNAALGRLKLPKISAFELNETVTGMIGVTPAAGTRQAQVEFSTQAEHLVDAFNATLDRYQAACARSEALAKSSTDSALLALNRVLHENLGEGGEIDIFMGAAQPLALKSRDPSTVREVVAGETRLIRIECAVATGSRLLNYTPQLELTSFETLADAVIYVADAPISEFIHKMPLGDAQNAWRGHREMSCMVELRDGFKPRVIGEIDVRMK
jgi:hypothetical protein